MPSSQRRSLADRRRRWDLIITSRPRILEILPHLDGEISELEAVEKDIRALVAKQVYYLGKAREVTGKIRTLSKRGDRLRGRIGASIRGKHGFDSMELVQYGFTPRRSKLSPEEEAVRRLGKDATDEVAGDSLAEEVSAKT
jgi:hypothetical protein